MPHTAANRTPHGGGYGLTPPTEGDVVQALARHLGREAAGRAWADALRATGLAEAGRPLPPGALARPVAHLASQPAPACLVGTAYAVRLRAYTLLARTTLGAAAGASRPPAPSPVPA